MLDAVAEVDQPGERELRLGTARPRDEHAAARARAARFPPPTASSCRSPARPRARARRTRPDTRSSSVSRPTISPMVHGIRRQDAPDVLENLPDVIGVLREGPLHRELKALLAAPGDAFEVKVDGYVIDLVRAGRRAGRDPDRRLLAAAQEARRAARPPPDPDRPPDPGPAADHPRRRGRRGALDQGVARRSRPRRRSSRASSPSPRCSSIPNLTIEVLLCRGGPHPQARAGPRPPLPARPGRAPPDRGAGADRAAPAPPTRAA